MHRSSILWLLCVATGSSCVVTTKSGPTAHEPRASRPEPRHEPPRPHRPSWNSAGWTLLGEQTVQGRNDRDVIRVGRRDGTFSKLMLVVEDSDLQLNDVIITYDNGRKHSPRVNHQFREGSRTAPIDLRGEARVIEQVELHYGNLPGGGRATVQLWGRSEGSAGMPSRTPPPPPPPPPSRGHDVWDSRGWTLMGEQWVRGGRNKDVIAVGARQGKFTKLMLVVDEGELNLDDIIIEYDNGRKHSPKLRFSFRDGSRTRPIDLRGEARGIRKVELRYSNMPRTDRAKVQLWGREG
ncbi:MAG TPA: hypothetical protein VKB80_19535 [Kofleriaceae bacterium]|nr:hypothetical protein [Kofleriaceae bacterium]